jgi:hypothetical protein
MLGLTEIEKIAEVKIRLEVIVSVVQKFQNGNEHLLAHSPCQVSSEPVFYINRMPAGNLFWRYICSQF